MSLTNLVVTTVVTPDHFQHYIPPFVYSLHCACPDYKAKIFLRGEIDEITGAALKFCPNNYEIVENSFLAHSPLSPSTNAIRFVVDIDAEYVYITDIDFVFFKHIPEFGDYYKAKMIKWGECYWSRRGPKRTKSVVTKRIAGGCFFASREWYVKTKQIREQMERKIIEEKIGKKREDDEVMLWNICTDSGMKCPTKSGNNRKAKYKELHLGDFKFPTRCESNRKMDKRITLSNMLKWFRLQEDTQWLKIREICSADGKIKDIFENVDRYMENRRRRFRENAQN